jgi:uncharacterized cupredoxin-like copper-binding protein
VITKRIVLVALLAASVLTACGKGDVKPASSGEPTTTTTEATTSTTEVVAEAEAASIELTGTEYAYQADGALSVPAGQVSVTLTNDGAEEHQATIVRFKDGKGLADLASVSETDPGALATVIDTFGGPNAVAPGGDTNTTTQTLEPGDYVFMCFIPAPDGQPHAAKGMAAPFTVTDGDAAGEAVEAENTLTAKEFAFDVEDGGKLSAGAYDFTNAGEQLHEVAVYAPAEGKTVDDVKAFFASPTPPAGPPPFVSAGGVTATNPGTSARFELVPGDYVFVCFLPDTDGAPHFTKGMITAVTVQ